MHQLPVRYVPFARALCTICTCVMYQWHVRYVPVTRALCTSCTCVMDQLHVLFSRLMFRLPNMSGGVFIIKYYYIRCTDVLGSGIHQIA